MLKVCTVHMFHIVLVDTAFSYGTALIRNEDTTFLLSGAEIFP